MLNGTCIFYHVCSHQSAWQVADVGLITGVCLVSVNWPFGSSYIVTRSTTTTWRLYTGTAAPACFLSWYCCIAANSLSQKWLKNVWAPRGKGRVWWLRMDGGDHGTHWLSTLTLPSPAPVKFCPWSMTFQCMSTWWSYFTVRTKMYMRFSLWFCWFGQDPIDLSLWLLRR